MICHSNRRHRFVLVPILALSAAPFASAPGVAATSCYTQDCSATCTPQAPVEIDTLVPAGSFPATGDTPTSFVDPGDGRGKRFITTQEGTVLLWNGIDGSVSTFLDLRDNVGGPVQSGGEQGLLSLAVDPDYRTTGHIYVFYTADTLGPGSQDDIVIARYTRSAANPDVGDLASALTILVISHQGAQNHNGGTVAFGPDGFLYITTGDGGPQCDNGSGASGDGQSPTTLAGKILRLDVRNVDPAAGPPDDCGVGTGNYEVPSGNPFFGDEPQCDEIWGLGFRNPFRMSFDRLTGDIYIGDVGQSQWEEINLYRASEPAPLNFGWVCREGCESSNASSGCNVGGCPVDGGSTCEFPRASGFWDPILCHQNTPWLSIMGGFRYRGERVPSISDDYIYGDASCGQIWKTTTLNTANPGAIAASCWASGYAGTYGFGEDALGEVYVVVGGQSRIACVHNGDGCTWANWGLFEDGFESNGTGEWSDTDP